MNIARVLVLLARAFSYSVVGLCQTPWDASILKVPRHFCIYMVGGNKSISIGTMIKAELERQERSVVWFAQHLSCDRTNVYRIFAKDSIDTELLIRICKVLNHNFFADISDSLKCDSSKNSNRFVAIVATLKRGQKSRHNVSLH